MLQSPNVCEAGSHALHFCLPPQSLDSPALQAQVVALPNQFTHPRLAVSHDTLTRELARELCNDYRFVSI